MVQRIARSMLEGRESCVGTAVALLVAVALLPCLSPRPLLLRPAVVRALPVVLRLLYVVGVVSRDLLRRAGSHLSRSPRLGAPSVSVDASL